MTLLRIIIKYSRATTERLWLIKLFHGRHRSGNLPTVLSLYRDRRSAIVRRAGLSRGHPEIVPRVRGINLLCSSTMPRLNVCARSSPSNSRRVLCAPFKETTTEHYQNKNRYDVPRGRIRASRETGILIANRVAIGKRQRGTE